MNKLNFIVLAGSLTLIVNAPSAAASSSEDLASARPQGERVASISPSGSTLAENASRAVSAQVPPIYMPTEPGGKVCWQITQMTPSDQVLQSACSVPLPSSGVPPLVPTPMPGPYTPTPQPVPTTPVTTPVEIKIKKQEVPTDKNNYQSQRSEQSNDQSGDKKETHSEATFIGELVLPALSVIKDLLD